MESSGLLATIPPFIYAGRVGCVTGYGAAARHQVWMLRNHGLRLHICPTGSTANPDPKAESPFIQSCQESSREPGSPRGTIIHLAPNCAQEWRDQTPGPHALVSVWETTRLPRDWAALASAYDQVWCATEWQAEVYRASGVAPDRIRVVPFALDPDLYNPVGDILPELQQLREAGFFIFGAMFQWTERKAPRALIGGFCEAFQRGEQVALVVKSYEGDDPSTSVQARIQEILSSYRLTDGQRPRIGVISRRLSEPEKDAFFRGIDCYVAPHRGEGFGLPIAEALLMGRPVICTDWSAPAEFAKGLFMPVPCTFEAPHSMGWQPFYSVDQQWAAPDVGALVYWMRNVWAGYPYVQPRDRVVSQFRALWARAGVAARAALEQLG